MNGAALLDVNVLVALFEPAHVHHDAAHDWFADRRTAGWATCPLTENGFIRVVSNAARGADIVRVPDLIARLRKFCASGHHQFWPDSISLCDEQLFNAGVARGHQQITDVYLLGLAVKRGGCLATFDRTVPVSAVKGARRDSLEVVSSADV